ncbi:hypothetical protein OG225_03060 [Nocardia sp. NBC_01377]|uniref:hypothetical protein n=1 Tax=Nocardia sp. NBC_01377 TaxID=2903595 RepID=UPI003246022D
MRRTSAALAASASVFALLLAGCNDDTATSSAAAGTSAAAEAASSVARVVDGAKAGTFVVSFKSAFPKLAQGRSDVQISDILNQTCSDLKSGKAEDAVISGVATHAKNGSTEVTKDEAAAIYQMAKLMCG